MAEKLKSLKDLHLQRKLFHVTGVMIVFACMNYLSENTCWAIYILLGIPFIIWDLSRQHFKTLNKFTLKFFSPVLRDYEEYYLSGVTYLILGVGICFYIFPKEVALLAVLFLAIGDPTASFFGVLYGQDKIIGNKSLQGSLAAFIACTVAAYIFFYSKSFLLDHILVVSFISGFIAAIAELLPVGRLDDNLTQPLVSSVLLSLLFYFFGGF